MVSKELADYVAEQRAKGYSDDTLRTVLMNAGYEKLIIEEALGAAPAQAQAAPIAPVEPQQPVVNSSGGIKKWGIIIAIVIILVVGGAAFAYVKNYVAPKVPLSTPLSGAGNTSSTSQMDSEGRDTQRISDLHKVQNDLELYYNKYGYYPAATSWSIMSGDIVAANIGIATSDIPNDPATGGMYYYQDFSGGQSYTVGAKLENDNSALTNTSTVPGIPNGMSTCTAASKELCLTL